MIDTADSAVSAPLRVVLAEDSYLVREALAHLLAGAPEVELVAVCEDADALHRPRSSPSCPTSC